MKSRAIVISQSTVIFPWNRQCESKVCSSKKQRNDPARSLPQASQAKLRHALDLATVPSKILLFTMIKVSHYFVMKRAHLNIEVYTSLPRWFPVNSSLALSSRFLRLEKSSVSKRKNYVACSPYFEAHLNWYHNAVPWSVFKENKQTKTGT